MNKNNEYKQLARICRLQGCYIPKEYEVTQGEASTPYWLRLWFAIKYKEYLLK